MEQLGSLALDVFNSKYAHYAGETWDDRAKAIGKAVLPEIYEPVRDRKFLPGGRYIYYSGREHKAYNNCCLYRADDSREGWSDLTRKAVASLMSGAGIGCVYSDLREEGATINKTGGTASGPLSLMQILNESGRFVMQGGSRRSAIWAGLHWWHPDIFKFIFAKDWDEDTRERKLKDPNTPARLDGTNISVILDTEFFDAYEDENHSKHSLAHQVYEAAFKRMMKTAEPGFSIDYGKDDECLRNAPVCAETNVLTKDGYKPVSELIGIPSTVWTGKQWADNVLFNKTYENANIVRVNMTGGRVIRCDESHPFMVERYKGAGKQRKLLTIERVAAKDLKPEDVVHVSMPEGIGEKPQVDADAYTLGYVYGDGSFTQAGGAEITFCTDESKQCVEVVKDCSIISSVTEKDSRGYTRAYLKVDPYWCGRHKKQLNSDVYKMSQPELCSFLAGLFDADGNWEPTQKRIRLSSIHEGFLRGVGRALEQLGVLASVSKSGNSTYGQKQCYQLVVMSEYSARFADIIPTVRLKPDLEGYKSYRQSLIKVLAVDSDGTEDVYCADVHKPEHTFMAEGVIISNCTEITSADDSDICNLGSINMARVESLEEFRNLVELGTMFLVQGTLKATVPHTEIEDVRSKNRRLGLGLMGIHEWLIKRGYKYEVTPELSQWLQVYKDVSRETATKYAYDLGISNPVACRAIAPTGTIAIMAETTSGIEPIFARAYKRNYLKNSSEWNYQVIIDPAFERIVREGNIDPSTVQDAYTLSFEERVAFQHGVQAYVDQAISSTINTPQWGSEANNPDNIPHNKHTLMKYLKGLRGVTAYPDGARGGQPLTPVDPADALESKGVIFKYNEESCKGGVCGI